MSEIVHQEEEISGILHTGEKILDEEDRGQTGWLDWTNETEALPGVKTARLYNVRSTRINRFNSDINVDPEHQYQGIARELFNTAVERVKLNSYEELIILGAHKTGSDVYRKILDKLVSDGRVRSYNSYSSAGYGYPSWHFRIKL